MKELEAALNLVMLPVGDLRANDYNPNTMDDAGFAELVAEVRHLGRLPKPVIVKRDGPGFVIVDGEHGWRAAQEAGLAEVPCEVVEVDDFEAMRQTYKRNQHGTHDPVRLGRMFRRMIEARGLSQRALAKEMEVSEGTVRNALTYADAWDVRNGYAGEAAAEGVSELSVRQVRVYLELPDQIRDKWLAAGAEPEKLYQALDVEIRLDDGTVRRYEFGIEALAELRLLKLDAGIEGSPQEFVRSVRRALQLWYLHGEHRDNFEDLAAYMSPVATLGLGVEFVRDLLPCKGDSETGKLSALLSIGKWSEILVRSVQLAHEPTALVGIVRASIQLALEDAGIAVHDVNDPRYLFAMRTLEKGPDFIRDADLPLKDKLELLRAEREGVPDDVLTEAKREAAHDLQTKYVFLRAGDEARRLIGSEFLEEMKARWSNETVDSLLDKALAEIQRGRALMERDALWADEGRLLDAAIKKMSLFHVLGTELIASRPALEVAKERIAALPRPERFLLIGTILQEPATESYWLRAARLEAGVFDDEQKADDAHEEPAL